MRDEFGAAFNSALGENVSQMKFDRRLTDVKSSRDFGVGHSLHAKKRDFGFAATDFASFDDLRQIVLRDLLTPRIHGINLFRIALKRSDVAAREDFLRQKNLEKPLVRCRFLHYRSAFGVMLFDTQLSGESEQAARNCRRASDAGCLPQTLHGECSDSCLRRQHAIKHCRVKLMLDCRVTESQQRQRAFVRRLCRC